MTPPFAATLNLIIQATNVGAQKIDGSPLETYSMASAGFSLQDNLGKGSILRRDILAGWYQRGGGLKNAFPFF